MTEILIGIVLAMLAVAVVYLWLIHRKLSRHEGSALSPRLDAFEKALERSERSTREEIGKNREEQSKMAREHRHELSESFKTLGDSVAGRIDAVRVESTTGAKQLREEVILTLRGITQSTTTTMGELAQRQQVQLEVMTTAISTLSQTNEAKLEAVRATVEAKLQNLQSDNAKQLEQMRQTVDEKLQGALEQRLGESFKLVSDRLELVHKGLGEMQALATGVGDLRKVLTNVKTRGTWGEVQLGALLDQVLTAEQYARNFSPKNGGERVEFAIKMPGPGQEEEVWLPIDAKFPIEDYQRLIEAQERADGAAVDLAGKQLEAKVRSCAADICKKYLNPPRTTDFGILYLPIEGLFAEVIRRTALSESLQRQYRVVIAGPTTLWSILNSLQMGFRTLAIQKRSSEVWNVLGAVKTEWSKYGELLEALKTKLSQATDTIDKAQARSRVIGKKLKDVEMVPVTDVPGMLHIENLIEEADGKMSESDHGIEPLP